MLKGMQHHYTKGFLYSVIKFEWSSYTQLSAHYSATTGSLFRTCGSIHSQYSHYIGVDVLTVAISCSKLIYQTSIQLDLFSDPEKLFQQEKLDYLCDEIRNRYGFKALVHASSLLSGATAISRSSKIGGH